MTFEIKDYFETPVILEPRVELYTVYDFMGKELPGLAIVLDDYISNTRCFRFWCIW